MWNANIVQRKRHTASAAGNCARKTKWIRDRFIGNAHISLQFNFSIISLSHIENVKVTSRKNTCKKYIHLWMITALHIELNVRKLKEKMHMEQKKSISVGVMDPRGSLFGLRPKRRRRGRGNIAVKPEMVKKWLHWSHSIFIYYIVLWFLQRLQLLPFHPHSSFCLSKWSLDVRTQNPLQLIPQAEKQKNIVCPVLLLFLLFSILVFAYFWRPVGSSSSTNIWIHSNCLH